LDVDEFGQPTDWLETLTAGEILGATQLAMPAFADARIVEEAGRLVAYVVPEGEITSDRRFIEPGALSWRDPAPLMFIDKTTDGHQEAQFVGNLTNFRRQPGELAATGLWRPPKVWFDIPEAPLAAPLTITEDGQIYGHLAEWQTCHIGFSDACVTAPTTEHGYSYFHTGTLLTDQGDELRVGQITLGTGHADGRLDPESTVKHYDHTGTAVADVRAIDGQHGVWVCGAVRPTATEDQIETLRRASLSGDWRRIKGHLELVAALAVNVPGFAVARIAAGEQVSLAAAGIVTGLRDEILERLSAEIVRLREEVDELKRPGLLERAKELAARFDQDDE
jgi:hypothetical protein